MEGCAVIKTFLALFARTPEQLAQHQCDDAHTKALQHAAEAEYHQAMADMYAKRMSRLMLPAFDQETPQ
jgi:hypothetical protein